MRKTICASNGMRNVANITGKCACHSQFATWYIRKMNNARSRLAAVCLNLRLHGFFQPLTEIYITPHHIHFTNLLPLAATISPTNICHIYPIERSSNNRLGVKSLIKVFVDFIAKEACVGMNRKKGHFNHQFPNITKAKQNWRGHLYYRGMGSHQQRPHPFRFQSACPQIKFEFKWIPYQTMLTTAPRSHSYLFVLLRRVKRRKNPSCWILNEPILANDESMEMNSYLVVVAAPTALSRSSKVTIPRTLNPVTSLACFCDNNHLYQFAGTWINYCARRRSDVMSKWL